MGELPEGTVTVLFTDLVDSTGLNQRLGDEGGRSIGRQVDQMARRLVADHRGILIKEMGDGVMAGFASARRAIACARQLQSEMGELASRVGRAELQMRIGLHTGEVLAEHDDIFGETVIVAKRIESVARPGTIVASETVHGVLGTDREQLDDLGEFDLKGLGRPWRLYEVTTPDTGGGSSTGESSPLVGRQAELTLLRRLVDGAVAGAGGAVLFAGPVGAGKSRLCREAIRLAEGAGLAWRAGHCVDMDPPPPNLPIIEQLEQTLRVLGDDGFRRALGINAAEVAALMPKIRDRFGDVPGPPQLPADQERRYVVGGVAEFVERSATARPLLLVFEDLHWADESTVLFLRHLLPLTRTCGLMIVGTYRPSDLDGTPFGTAISSFVRDLGATDHPVRPLGRDDLQAILRGRAEGQPPADLIDLLYAETQGNPFFAEELVRHLDDSGRLVDGETGTWRRDFDLAETEVPSGVLRVISQRLDRLDPESRKLLGRGAVLGRVVSFELLVAVCDSDDDDVFDALEDAGRLGIIDEIETANGIEYLFVHEQFRQALLAELAATRRQRLHVRAADALVATEAGSPAVVADHLVRAGRQAPSERVVDALLTAAESANRALAFEDALRHLDLADQQLDDTTSTRAAGLRADAVRGTGAVEDALGVISRAVEDATPDERWPLLRQRVSFLLDLYRGADALDDIAELLDVAAAAGDDERRLDVLLAKGRAHYVHSLDHLGHAELSLAAYEEALALAETRDDRANMIRALVATTWFTDYWSDYRETADANIERASRLAAELGDADLALDCDGAALRRQGAAADIDLGEELIERLDARRDPARLNAGLFWMMWVYYDSARFEDCVATCDRGIELADRIGVAPVQYGSIKSLALTALGRFDLVDGALAQEIADDDHPFGQAMHMLGRTVFLSGVGAWSLARDHAEQLVTAAIELSRTWMASWAAEMLALAEAHLGRARHDFVTAPDPYFGYRVTSALAEVQLVSGNPRAALEAASEILEDERVSKARMDASLTAAKALIELGEAELALDRAIVGLELADRSGYELAQWRLGSVAATAADRLGRAEAAESFRNASGATHRALLARLVDDDLRAAFVADPLASGF